MTHEEMSLEEIVEDFEHPEWGPEQELTMGIIDLLPEETEPTYHSVEREENRESNLPLEGPLGKLEQQEDARYSHSPERVAIDNAIEQAKRESPAEIKARQEREHAMFEIVGAIYGQSQEDREPPVLRQTQWDL